MTSLLQKATSIIPQSLVNLVNTTFQQGVNYVRENPVNVVSTAASQIFSIMDKMDQYNSLFMEAKDAIIFIDKINDWALYIVNNNLYGCQKTWGEFMLSLYECTKYLQTNYMNPKGQFYQSLIKHSNAVRDVYKKVTDPDVEPKTRMQKLQAIANSSMIYYYPNYYRQELAFRLLRVIELMNTVKFDMEMQQITNTPVCSNMGDKLKHLNVTPINVNKQDIRSTIRILNRMETPNTNKKASPKK